VKPKLSKNVDECRRMLFRKLNKRSYEMGFLVVLRDISIVNERRVLR
jgi:hypothetical protein